jgi:hypothetical protein
MSFPLCSVVFLISMPCAAKKPFWIPRSSGSAFAIGSVFTVMVVTVAPGAPVAAPPSAAATRTTGIAATTSRLRNGSSISVIGSSLCRSTRIRSSGLDAPVRRTERHSTTSPP